MRRFSVALAVLVALLLPVVAQAQGSAGTVNVKNYVTQGSTTAGQTGSLTLGAVTTSAPSYSNGQSSPISLDTAGNVRITCASGCASAADTTAASQAISGAAQTFPNASAGLSLAGAASAVFQLQSGGTLVATVAPFCSFDGAVTWATAGYFQDPVTGVLTGSATIASGQATTKYLAVCPTGASHVEIADSGTANFGTAPGYTSGSANFLGRATAKHWPDLAWGQVSSGAPTYTTGTINSLSLNTAGELRVLASQNGTWGTVVNGAAAVFSFKASLSGAEAALATNTAKRLYVRADLTNTDAIYLGTTGVATTTGYMLNPGDTLTVDVANSNAVHAIVGSGTQVIYALGIN